MLILNRAEMKGIMAGEEGAFIRCENCQNSSCEGWADDCVTGAYEICGPGPAGTPGPAPYDCTTVMEA